MACEVDDCYWRPRRMHPTGENATTGNRKSYGSQPYMLQAAMLKLSPSMLRPEKLETLFGKAGTDDFFCYHCWSRKMRHRRSKRGCDDEQLGVATSGSSEGKDTGAFASRWSTHSRWLGQGHVTGGSKPRRVRGGEGKKTMTWGKAKQMAPACWIRWLEAN